MIGKGTLSESVKRQDSVNKWLSYAFISFVIVGIAITIFVPTLRWAFFTVAPIFALVLVLQMHYLVKQKTKLVSQLKNGLERAKEGV